MVDKSLFMLEGKSNEEVKTALLQYLEMVNIQPTGYSRVGSNNLVSKLAKKLFGVHSILSITDVAMVNQIIESLTKLVDGEKKQSKRHQLVSVRCHVKKYADFVAHCEKVKNEAVYDFSTDSDKPFISEEKFKKIVTLLSYKKNIILEGAPGVGKTFLARKIAYQLIGGVKEECIEMVQFHQSYGYEDFIQGIRPTENGGFEVRDGIFYNFCNRARQEPELPFVFIIDEINRGNISKILGELMMLIEADKRSEKYAIKLTYGDEKFYVPDNVYIIGCMNTADRSLAIVDYALRRRFKFCTIEPEFNDAFKLFLVSKGLQPEKVDQLISKVESANSEISDIDKRLEIGHSYFCQTDGAENFNEWWEDICEYELFPYVREICFDDDDKCQSICKKLKF